MRIFYKIKIQWFFTFLAIIFFSKINAQNVFQHSYNITKGWDMGCSVQETFDGGYVVAGFAGYYSTNCNVLLMKINANGDTLWTKEYGGIKEDEGWHVEQTADSGFVISADTKSFGAGDTNIYIIRTDKNGNILWEKIYGGINYEDGAYLTVTPDGGFSIVGTTTSFGAGLMDIHVMKTNALGDTIWTKTYGGLKDEHGALIRNTLEDGYYVGGSTESFGAGNFDYYLIKTNSNGDTLWTRTYGGNKFDQLVEMVVNNDSGITLVGQSKSYSSGNYDMLMIRIDKNGNLVWAKNYYQLTDNVGYAIQRTDNGYIIVGYGTGHLNGLSDEYLIRTDYDGNILWAKAYGDTREETPFGISVGNNGIVTVGVRQNPVSLYYELYIFKRDTSGFSGCKQGDVTSLVVSDVTPTVSSGAVVGSAPWIITNGTSVTDTFTVTGIDFCDSCSASPTASFLLTSTNNLEVGFTSEIYGATSFYWDFGDGSTGTEVNPIHTYANDGSYDVCLHVSNLCGNYTFCHNIKIVEIGIFNSDFNSRFSIYPNPTSGKISIVNKQKMISYVEIYNLIGEKIYQENIVNSSVEIDISREITGIYFLKIISDSEIYFEKLVKRE